MKLLQLAVPLSLLGCATNPDPGPNVVEDPQAITGCRTVTTVLLYSEGTYELTLPDAFAAQQDPCTRYYVDLPHLAADATMPRDGVDGVHALGPNFHAMAEFSWSGWAEWIARSPGTRDWQLAGQTFRQRMADAGYDPAAGDIWVINEFPSDTWDGGGSVLADERTAVRSLAHDGVKGVAFIAGVGQSTQNFAWYKPNIANWLSQSDWWVDMNHAVRWMSYEVYAEPHDNCVIDSNVVDDADQLNLYLEHVPALAEHGGGATATALSYLSRAYVPLVSAAWNSNNGFGDNTIALGDFERFSRLQVYATHVWAAHNAYPGRRIGFAWAPVGSTAADDAELSGVIAESVANAYPANGFANLAKYACSSDGSLDDCGCTVSGS